MASDQFRRSLRQEGDQWQREGLLSEAQWQRLRDRYALDALEAQAENRFTLILMALGAVLVGIGVITYGAANWEEIPKVVRSVGLFGAFLATSFGGFGLFRSADSLKQKLGDGLLLLGGMLIGANMALMSQMFHLTGPLHPLFVMWSLAVVVMAYGLRHRGLAILAVALMGIGGYWGWGESSWWWSGLNRTPQITPYSIAIANLPLLAGLLFIPLAYRCRSAVVFTMTLLVILSSFISMWMDIWTYSGRPFGVLLLILPTVLLWSYDDTLWNDLRSSIFRGIFRGRSRVNPIRESVFKPIAQIFSILNFGTLLYLCSFRWNFLQAEPNYTNEAYSLWRFALVGLVTLLALAVVQWVYLVRSQRRNLNSHLAIGGMATVFVISALITPSQPDSMFTFLMNALLAVLGIGCIRESLLSQSRSAFWYGMGLIVLQIFSRVLEYDSDLLFKALMFVMCGMAIIAAGIWFEKSVRRSPAVVQQHNTEGNES
jgi:uncharacterized membrane protein